MISEDIGNAEDGARWMTLTISPEKVCFIIIKAKEFDAKDEVTDPDPGLQPSDDGEAAVLEDHEDDPVVEELTSLSMPSPRTSTLISWRWLGLGARIMSRRLDLGTRGGGRRL